MPTPKSTTSPKITPLDTVEEVLEALGPVRDVMRLTRAQNYQTIHNWKDRKVFPANLYLTMTQELERRGYTAPAALWQQVDPAPNPEKHAATQVAAAG